MSRRHARPRGRRPNRVLLLPAVVIGACIAAVGVVLIVGALSSSGPSTSTDSGPGVDVGSAFPMSYVIVYRVNSNGVNQWEVLSVQRPFSASDLTYMSTVSPRPGDQPSSGNLSTTTDLYAVDTRSVRLVSGRQPAPPSGDEFVGAEISELTRRGLANDLRQSSTIVGRACRMYRFSGPLMGAVAPLGTQADHDDMCLDAEGLVMSESWTYHGKVVRQRTAVHVETSSGSVVDSSVPSPPSTAGAIAPTVYAATITTDPHPSTFIHSPSTPPGFTATGPAVDFRLPDPQHPALTAATSVVWAFTAGPRVITVEAGTEGGALPWSNGDTVTVPVTLAGLGPAQTAAASDRFELRIDLGGGQWVRVAGTVPLDQLVAYAHHLTRAATAPTAG